MCHKCSSQPNCKPPIPHVQRLSLFIGRNDMRELKRYFAGSQAFRHKRRISRLETRSAGEIGVCRAFSTPSRGFGTHRTRSTECENGVGL